MNNNKYILDYFNCSNITECYQITNECCKNINKIRQYERTKDETIVVGLELPNNYQITECNNITQCYLI